MAEDRIGRGSPYVRTVIGNRPVIIVRREIWHPATDVYETDSTIIVKVDVAGVSNNDMEVLLDENLLMVRGRRSDCSGTEKVAVHRLEINCGEFETHVHLPRAVRVDVEPDCSYKDGILTVVLAKVLAHRVPVAAEE